MKSRAQTRLSHYPLLFLPLHGFQLRWTEKNRKKKRKKKKASTERGRSYFANPNRTHESLLFDSGYRPKKEEKKRKKGKRGGSLYKAFKDAKKLMRVQGDIIAHKKKKRKTPRSLLCTSACKKEKKGDERRASSAIGLQPQALYPPLTSFPSITPSSRPDSVQNVEKREGGGGKRKKGSSHKRTNRSSTSPLSFRRGLLVRC